ncbi:MAG: catalase family peroxidase [Solirubrobacterales bacterium]
MAEGTQEPPRGGEIHRRLIEAMSDISGVHAGRRTVHAKGVWAEGMFTGSPEAAAICRAPQLAGDLVPALVRFSKASGKPDTHDANRDGGGMAVKLRTGGSEWDIVATGPPVFVARTVEDFLELLRLRKPDPQTGRPDMEALGEYLGRHPEAQLAIQSTLGAEPAASLVAVPYFSPHAFALLHAGGTRTWVRWSWQPAAGEERVSDDEARERGRDYLRDELAERLAAGPATMELRFQVAGADDSLTDPTELWPAERDSFVAARLEISGLVEDPEGDGHIEVFDPTRLPDGIEPSDDPILHARPRAYSVSAYRRLGEE